MLRGLSIVDCRNLRIPDGYHAKTLEKQTPLLSFASYFHNQAIFQTSECSFFDQVAIDIEINIRKSPSGSRAEI